MIGHKEHEHLVLYEKSFDLSSGHFTERRTVKNLHVKIKIRKINPSLYMDKEKITVLNDS